MQHEAIAEAAQNSARVTALLERRIEACYVGRFRKRGDVVQKPGLVTKNDAASKLTARHEARELLGVRTVFVALEPMLDRRT